MDNRANQKNPNNSKYWQSQGYSDKPSDWKNKYETSKSSSSMSKSAQDYKSQQKNPNNDLYYKNRYNNGKN